MITHILDNDLIVTTSAHPDKAGYTCVKIEGDLKSTGIPIVYNIDEHPSRLTILALPAISVGPGEMRAQVFGPNEEFAGGSMSNTFLSLTINVRDRVSDTWVRIFEDA